MYWLMVTMSSMEPGLFNMRYALCKRNDVLCYRMALQWTYIQCIQTCLLSVQTMAEIHSADESQLATLFALCTHFHVHLRIAIYVVLRV